MMKINNHRQNSTLELENSFKPINICVNDMDKFEKKELTKKRTFTTTFKNKHTLYRGYNCMKLSDNLNALET